MGDDSRASLAAVARRINEMAVMTVEQDGEHAAMFFLRQPDGSVEPHMFETTADPPGDARGREMAAAVQASPADAVVIVSEAWRAKSEGRGRRWLRARDAPDVEDILLVVGLDRAGNQVVFETVLSRQRNGAVKAVSTDEHAGDYVVHTLNDVRSAWGLPRRLAFWDGAFSAAVPPGWTVTEDAELVTLEPPSRRGAAQFSVLRRREPVEPEQGEASEFVLKVARGRGIEIPQPSERPTSSGFAAVASFDEAGDERVTRWIAGAQTSRVRAVLYTYNDDGSEDELRDAAAEIFESIVVGSS